MEGTTHDYGYEFTVSLCEAIAEFTKKEEEKKADIFVYKGANLRFALERAFYPRYSRDREFLKLFSQYTEGVNISATFSDPIKKSLLLLMCQNIDPEKIQIKKNIAKNLSKKIISVILQPLKKILSNSRKRTNRLRFQNTHMDTLLCTNLPRFVRYSNDIAKLLPSVRYFSLAFDMRTFFKKNNLPFLNFSGFGKKISRFSTPDSYLESFGLKTTYDLIYESLYIAKPKTVVVIEGQASVDEVTNQACKQLSIPCICIQQGWNNLAETGIRNMTFSKMLTWGDGFTELLQPYSPKQKFIPTGSHIIAPFPESRNTHDAIKTIAFFTQPKSQVLNEQKENDFLGLLMWTAGEFPDIRIIVREHPNLKETVDREMAKKFTNIAFMNPREYSLSETLGKSDLLVTICSTTILESITMGVVPLILNNTSQPRYWPDVDAFGAGIEVKNIEQAKKTITDFARGTLRPSQFYENMLQFRKKYFSASGKVAAENIAKEIMNV